MKNNHLLNLIGEIDDRYIEEVIPVSQKKKVPLLAKVLVAACVCIVVGLGYSYFNPSSIESIIDNGSFTNNSAEYITPIMVDGYKATYEKMRVDGKRLKSFVGDEYISSDSLKWFYVEGYDNIKYLVLEDANGKLTLWRFSHFNVTASETYTYGDVLRLIYNVDCAEDIVSITTSPFNADNSDAGKAMQAEVGTHTYTDRDDILAFYEVVKDVICYGPDTDNPADDTRFTYSFSAQDGHYLVAKDGIYGTRCISIKFTDGTTHDTWKYSALSGSFFEYGSIFTEPMDESDVYILNDIFGIK
ncbi:MAG: hypothetical protein IJE49_09580 [Agathobacter sp.]|nr:hypothetical protein [Agathobacter sp.]